MLPVDWAVLIATMIATARRRQLHRDPDSRGDRLSPRARGIVATWIAGSLKASIVVTLTFGIFVTVIETMRARLDEATVALRTKERDEAEARRLAAEAQLASIESRVQPHFLFNTLNSIAALVHDDPAGAERMTGAARVAAALVARQHGDAARPARRGAARSSAPISTSSACGSAIACATTIQLDDGGRVGAPVPRMALQTLVENSVKYAVSPRREGGRSACARPPPTAASGSRWKTTARGSMRRIAPDGPRPGAAAARGWP